MWGQKCPRARKYAGSRRECIKGAVKNIKVFNSPRMTNREKRKYILRARTAKVPTVSYFPLPPSDGLVSDRSDAET